MTATENPRGRRSTRGTLTVLAVTVIESPVVRRVTRTRLGRGIRATPMADRAVRALGERYRVEMTAREVVGFHGAPRPANRTGSLATRTTHRPSHGSSITRFAIIGDARTGSTLLRTELNRRWPEIRCLGEVLGLRLRRSGETTEAIAARVFAPTDDNPIVGCKIFYSHVTHRELQGILTMPGMKVIHLRRRNILRRYVSLEIARNNNIWAQGLRKPYLPIDERALTIDVDNFFDSIPDIVRAQRVVEQSVADAGVDVLDVWYEDLSEHLDGELRRVAKFLGAGEPAHESDPILRRQNPEPLRLLVRNYDEVRNRLSLSSMRVFLDPEDTGRRRLRIGRRTERPTCWPTERQELLLRAVLLAPDDAGDAFAQWRNVSNPYEIDDASQRLLPMVYRNLRRAGLETSLDALMRDAYVRASVGNQVLLRTLERVVSDLHDGGVSTLVLEGAALTVLHYRDRGTRPMADLDVMVPRELAGRALEALRAEGWHVALPGGERSIDQLLRTRRAVPLRRGDDDLHLHWYALATRIGTDLEAELWDASVEMDIRGQRTRALAPADQLLHTVARGLRYDPVSPFRWVADAHVVITSSGEAVDWDQLVRRADRYGLSPCVAAAFGYLDGQYPGLVPPSAVAAARSLPVTRRERRDFEHSTRAASPWTLSAWRGYRRREADRGFVRDVAGFAEELPALAAHNERDRR